MGTIKSFKKFIEESIWSDIQDRSSGEVVRKEDENKCTDYAKKYAPVVMKAIQDAGLGKNLYSNEFESIMFFNSGFAQYLNDSELIDVDDYDDSKIASVGIKKDFKYDDYFCTYGDLFVGCITPSDGSSDINIWIEFSYGDEDAEDDMEPSNLFYSVADDEWDSMDLPAPDRNNCDIFMKKLLSTITMAVNPKTKYTPKWFGI
jgi:hypothetical protein